MKLIRQAQRPIAVTSVACLLTLMGDGAAQSREGDRRAPSVARSLGVPESAITQPARSFQHASQSNDLLRETYRHNEEARRQAARQAVERQARQIEASQRKPRIDELARHVAHT